MASSVSELREEIMALTGVDIMIDDDTFKSTYDILQEISEVWDDLTDVSQANVTELLAGKRQGNIMSSLMENFDIAESVLATSETSEGSATEEHEKWLDSIEAKLQQLEAAWQSLSSAVIDSELLKSGIDFLTDFVNVLTEIIDNVGALGTAIGAITIGTTIKSIT